MNKKSEHLGTVHESECIIFRRVDLVQVCGIDLDVMSAIELRPGRDNMSIAFDVLTDGNGIGPRFEWPGWYRPWEGAMNTCARRDMLRFLDDLRADCDVEGFAAAFRQAMSVVFDFAMSKLPLCDDAALWKALTQEHAPV